MYTEILIFLKEKKKPGHHHQIVKNRNSHIFIHSQEELRGWNMTKTTAAAAVAGNNGLN